MAAADACADVVADGEPDLAAPAPVVVPVLGALTCAFLIGPWTGRDLLQYKIAGALLALGVGLWFLTWLWNRGAPSGAVDVVE